MPKLSKKQKVFQGKVQLGKQYPLAQAVKIIKECATAKFDESIDISINLGIDPKKSEQGVRSSVVLPHGTGKKVRVAVITQGEMAKAAEAAGADLVGFDDLGETIKGGKIDFDVLIASPDAMRIVGQLGQILGPRGLMPNPKVGTVTNDIGNAVKNAKTGQVRYRTDKAGIVHCTIGKASFAEAALQQNFAALIADIRKNKPNTSKGIYLKKITISSTMGPGVVLDQASFGE